ncbi:LysR family transcriptional regulator [Marinobacterium sp. CAU 1594]|nr:LysR family transcriptional regulator [Marinobacterium arenosum]
MLQAVVEHGGFSQASEAIHKSQSTINQAVHKLQDLIGVPLLEVRGRKAYLTDQGKLLLRRAQQLLEEAEKLEEVADSLRQGAEAEINIAVNRALPPRVLHEALSRFAANFPHTRIELHETVLGGSNELLLNGQVELAITDQLPDGYLGDPLLEIHFIAVAAPDHPLHRIDRPLTLQDLKPYRQIVVRDSAQDRRRTAGWLGAEQRWTVTDVSTSIAMICNGLGYAWLPQSLIEQQLAQQCLLALPLREGAERSQHSYIVAADPDRLGPGARYLQQQLIECCQSIR